MLHSEAPQKRHGRGRQLKVGYVLKRFPRLTETFILNEILELERQGVEVEIYSLLQPRDEPRHALVGQIKASVYYLSDKATIDRLMAKRLDGLRNFCNDSFASHLQQSDTFPDLMPGKKPRDAAHLAYKAMTISLLALSHGVQHLHAHFGSDATTAALLAGRMTGLPFSFTAHARDIYHTYVSAAADDRARQLKIDEARFVVTVSNYNRQHLCKIANRPDKSAIIRLYNGVDLERFSQPTYIHRRSNHVLSVGRLVEKKGIGDLVSACKVLRESGVDFDCSIVGDGPLRGELEAAIESTGLAEHVHLLGSITQAEVLDLMRSATILVLPCTIASSGDRDGLPTVLLEALGCGLPAISTDVAGIPEIISDGRNGLTVAPNNPEELAAAMQKLLADDHLRSRFAKAGRERAARDFDLTTNVARLRSLFEVSAGDAAPANKGYDLAHRIH